jgi:hypothetical protein
MAVTPLPSARTYMFTEVGSGSSLGAVTQFVFGTATTAAESGRVHYAVQDLAKELSVSSAPHLVLVEKTRDPLGAWLASTEGMLVEGEWNPPGAYARALDEVKDHLGVTLTYIARCLRMQRSAVYRWYDGRQPHASNRSRLKTLQEFATVWHTARLPSLRNYWDTPVTDQAAAAGRGATLGQLLSAEVLNINSLRDAIARLTSGAAPLQPTRPKLGFPGRKRDRERDRQRFYDLVPPTSHEGDDEGGKA